MTTKRSQQLSPILNSTIQGQSGAETTRRSARELFRSILLPISASPEHECLLPQACFLSSLWHCETVVLQLNHRADTTTEAFSQTRKPDNQLIRSRLLNSGASAVRFVESCDSPAQAIEDTAHCHGCSMILLPAECETSAPPPWFGTTLQRLLRRAPTPLLIMKSESVIDFQSVLTIAEPTDSSETALKYSTHLARIRHSHLTIIRIVPDTQTIPDVDKPVWSTAPSLFPRETSVAARREIASNHDRHTNHIEQNRRLIKARDELFAMLSRCDISDIECDLRIVSGVPATQVLLMARKRNSGLIVAGSQPRGGQINLMHRNIVEVLSETTALPILVFPDISIPYID